MKSIAESNLWKGLTNTPVYVYTPFLFTKFSSCHLRTEVTFTRLRALYVVIYETAPYCGGDFLRYALGNEKAK